MKMVSEQDSAEIFRLVALGWRNKQIAASLGISKGTVWAHIYWKKLSPEQREEKRIKDRQRRPSRAVAGLSPRGQRVFDPVRPPDSVVAERDARMSRPFNIRCDILGEPEPGRSALDRKMAEASA